MCGFGEYGCLDMYVFVLFVGKNLVNKTETKKVVDINNNNIAHINIITLFC